jgi:hypothetical protein
MIIDERSAVLDPTTKIQTVQRTTVSEIVKEVLIFEKQ